MAGIWKFGKSSKSPGPDPKLGLVFNRPSQTFEGENPGFLLPQSSAQHNPSVVGRRLTMADISLFSKNIAWLMPTDWEPDYYTTPYPAWVLSADSSQRLTERGYPVHHLPWPDQSMSSLDYCASLHSEELAKVADPASRIQLYLRSRDNPITVSWGGADDPSLVYRIEGQDFYQAVADSHALCRNALLEYWLGALDFNQPLDYKLTATSALGSNPWVEDVEVRFSPFYRSPKAPAANCNMNLLAYMAD